MSNFEMGCENGEDEIHSNGAIGKRFKFPKKFFDECNGVDHVSVPRKLRSAIKKRRRHSISPTLPVSKKLNHMSDGAGDETLRKAINKSKLNLTHCGSSQCVKELEGPITKEEEEVAETLYALAGLIPDSGTMSESELKSLALPEPETTSMIASGQVVKEEQEIRITSSQVNAEASKQFPDAAVSAGEAAKSMSIECDTSIDSIRTEQLEISQHPVVACEYQANQLNTLKEKRRNGSLLWPGLSVEGSPFSNILGSSTELPIAKFPAWFGSTATDAQAQKAESCLPIVKNSQVPLDLKKSFKRCAAHVYISRLIKVLHTTAKEETISSQPSQLSSHDGLKQQGTHIIHNSLTGKVNDMHGIVPTGGIACSTTERNPTEVRNAILLHKRLLQDQQQASTSSGFNSLAKQNMDLLSLSAGSYVIKGTNVTNIAGHNLEAPLNSQNHPTLRFLLPQNGYSSTSFRCLPATSVAQQLQVLLPPYLGGSSTHPSLEAAMALPRQPSQHVELQKLQNVSANVTAQYNYGASALQIRDWQNTELQTPFFRPSQAQLVPSSSSMEPLSSNYSPALLNDHELSSISTSRATSRNRGQYYNIPYGLEGNAHGLYPNNVPSLQLLCNDHR